MVRFKVPRLRPPCPSDKISIKLKMSVELWWNVTDRGKREYWRKAPLPVSLRKTHPTWTGLELNPGLCGERPANHSLKHRRVVYCLYLRSSDS